MKINEMFLKRIERDIQGVIIAGQGDDEAVQRELEEYVVTRELQRHFSDFFAAYKKGILGETSKMGTWISGFFGSGKSLLLKIFSYLLENKTVGGKRAIDYFTEDEKITDSMVLADMKLASDTPTTVILFNIDAKSAANGKQDKDAIVNVFLRVFNEKLGFCGAIPHLADLERRLSEVGRYDEFKAEFEIEYGKPWIDSRHKFDFIQDTVVDVLSNMGFMSESAARNWCEKATEPYQISIEDFAGLVKQYLVSKGKNHHLVFCVDEIGQYIGEDSKLMLNLQTVTEELGRECKGKVWVIVTSQQDIDSVTKVKGNDFSKIQGRFDTRLALSSANVDAVIKKRLLTKNETAAQMLRLLYSQKATDIKNKICFTGAEKKLYQNAEDFVTVYPFVPYQFNLLASVLTAIRTHGASGKHLSEGERSMLALFRESAMSISGKDTGALVPFHGFYDALENFLDHSHRSVIIRAFDNSQINPDGKTEDVFAINVLKTLFLIKYVEQECEATLDNITSLMYDNMDCPRDILREQVNEALKVLMRQGLVQKNGTVYIFLTDEEQEINRAIEGQNIEMSVIIRKASELIFDDIFTSKKYQVPAFNGRYAFGFNQFVDDRPYKINQGNDIGLRVLTPWYEGATDVVSLRMLSEQQREVVVVLPSDDAFLNELRTYLKIESFLQGSASKQITKYALIKEAKRIEMRERMEHAKTFLKQSLSEAVIYVNSDTARLNAKDTIGKFNEALGRLVQKIYHKLPYIDTAMGESDIRRLFRPANQVGFDLGETKTANQHALDDVLSFIASNSNYHLKTSMKTVKERFMKAPYGFVEDDVHWLIAKLFRNGDIDFSLSSEPVSRLKNSDEEIIGFITKKQFVEKLLVEQHVRIEEPKKKAVREVMKELFHVPGTADDEEALMQSFQSYSEKMILTIEKLESNYSRYAYPGKKILAEGKKLLRSSVQLTSPMDFYTTVARQKDDYLDFAEDYEPIQSFFGGEQMEIFTRALDMLAIYEDSKTYIVDQTLEETVAGMRSIVRREQPYSEIHKLPELRKKFMDAYEKVLESETAPVLDSIDQDRGRVMEALRGKPYEDEKRGSYIARFEEIRKGAESCNNVSVLRSYADKASALKIRLLDEMVQLDAAITAKKAAEEAARAAEEAKKKGEPEPKKEPSKVTPKPKVIRNVPIKKLSKASSWRLESKEDIEKYLAALRAAMESELSASDIVNVEF